MGERNVPGQLGLFHLTKHDSGAAGVAHWMYPCGLCNGADVAEAGGLCSSCAPVPVRKATRRRTTATTKAASKTTARTTRTKAAAKTSARPVHKGTPRKVSPAQVKTAMRAMRWCA
ncbi:hypothetical protein [Actinopolymorpha pittospori]|uniref:Uncharacterized protein n=1 Tax=Actinopolymorpha pittospori TaxID=648752 RepID=A0A927N3B9_9ACTN|nr:hypothetical protein [Actinopolymorpha pittospori]MBE1610972.1 hypothetical protein [Actinopolymorpha pittospori]